MRTVHLSVQRSRIRKQLGWKCGESKVPQQVYHSFREHAAAGISKQGEWHKVWEKYQQKKPEPAAPLKRAVLDSELPEGRVDALPKLTPDDKGKATRPDSQDCIDALANILPELIGGSADLHHPTWRL